MNDMDWRRENPAPSLYLALGAHRIPFHYQMANSLAGQHTKSMHFHFWMVMYPHVSTLNLLLELFWTDFKIFPSIKLLIELSL